MAEETLEKAVFGVSVSLSLTAPLIALVSLVPCCVHGERAGHPERGVSGGVGSSAISVTFYFSIICNKFDINYKYIYIYEVRMMDIYMFAHFTVKTFPCEAWRGTLQPNSLNRTLKSFSALLKPLNVTPINPFPASRLRAIDAGFLDHF